MNVLTHRLPVIEPPWHVLPIVEVLRGDLALAFSVVVLRPKRDAVAVRFWITKGARLRCCRSCRSASLIMFMAASPVSMSVVVTLSSRRFLLEMVALKRTGEALDSIMELNSHGSMSGSQCDLDRL